MLGYARNQPMIKKLPLKEYFSIYSKVPRLCVELVIKDKDGGVLLTLRDISPAKGFWHLPGGTVSFNESIESAVKRIGKEELGVSVSSLKFLQYLDWFKSKNSFGRVLSLVFEAKIDKGSIKLDKNASDFGFFKHSPKNIVSEHKKMLF